MDITFIFIINLIGTFVFAISGIRIASSKQMDWFGAYIIGLVTAVGGGTVRDLLLGVTPFWIEDSIFFLMTGVALLSTLVFKDRIFRWSKTLFLFDAIGLGLFTVVGISKSINAGLPIWVCIVMGMITGSVGGITRDILLNEIPLLFRKDIYALACIAGGVIYFSCDYFALPKNFNEFLAAGSIMIIRIVAVKFHINLPTLNPIEAQLDRNKKNR